MFFLISTKSRIGAVKKRKFFYNPLGIGKKVQKGESNPWLMIFELSSVLTVRISALTFAKAL